MSDHGGICGEVDELYYDQSETTGHQPNLADLVMGYEKRGADRIITF
jgi:hypothetical protein